MRSLTFLTLISACILVAAGCGNRPPKKAAEKAEHSHGAKGPHKGLIVEVVGNDDYHFEFDVDHDKKEATVYVLDEKAKELAPIEIQELTLTLTHDKKPIQMPMKAVPDAKDGKKASKFVATHEEFARKMDFKGEIQGMIDGKPCRGKFEEKDHEKEKK